jgi:hypothetical protein
MSKKKKQTGKQARVKELLYPRAQGLYRPGDRIKAGNWGRLILGTGPGHPRFYAEYLLERIRRDEFADAPSRMDGAFAFESLDFAASWDRGVEYVYAVRLIAPRERVHRGDMGWIDAMNEHRSFDGVEECARRYWRGDDREPKAREVVSPGGFEVIERLTRLPEDSPP